MTFNKNGGRISINALSEIDHEKCSGIQMRIDTSADMYASRESLDLGIGVFLDGLEQDQVIRIASICSSFSCTYSASNEIAIKIEIGSQSELQCCTSFAIT